MFICTLLIGLSFQGSVAQQLSTICPEVKYCVLLDTYNYFEFPSYVEKRPKWVRMKNILKNTLISGDYRILKDFIKGRIATKEIVRNETVPVRKNRLLELWLGHYPAFAKGKATIPNNCLFFRATRDSVFHPTHGYNWRKYVNGNFSIVNLKCTHFEIIGETHSKVIAEKITETIG